MMKNKKKYIGFIFVLFSFFLGYIISQFEARDKIEISEFKKVYFIDATHLINPPFIHFDNQNFYTDSEKIVAFRSMFFSPGVAVIDLNNDDWQDFIVVSSENGSIPQVYINIDGERFENKTDDWVSNNNLKDDVLDTNISPFIFDEDGDGDQDLLVTNLHCNKFYLNTGNKFEYKKNHPLNKICENGFSLAFNDFNLDNKVDILFMKYWNNRWARTLMNIESWEGFKPYEFVLKVLPRNIFNAKNGGSNTVLFKGDPIKAKIGKNNRWTFDALVTDINNDNIPELVIVNDFGPNFIYNYFKKRKKFRNVTRKYTYPDRRNGMSIATNYLPNNPIPYIYVSNIFLEHYVEKGNFYWNFDKRKKKLIDQADKYNLNDCQWAWGAVFSDFNLDGYNDVYIANGYLSSNKKETNKEGAFRFASLSSLPVKGGSKKIVLSGYSVSTENRTNAFEVNYVLNSVSGYQKDCLRLYSPKDETFVDFSEEGSLNMAWDGRAVATIDFDNDGDLDLLVTNQNNYLRLIKNTIQETRENNWIGFKITNHQAIKKIVLRQGKVTYTKDWNSARTGFLSTSDPRIHFGLMSSESVTITFKFTDNHDVSKSKLKPGQYYDLGRL